MAYYGWIYNHVNVEEETEENNLEILKQRYDEMSKKYGEYIHYKIKCGIQTVVEYLILAVNLEGLTNPIEVCNKMITFEEFVKSNNITMEKPPMIISLN